MSFFQKVKLWSLRKKVFTLSGMLLLVLYYFCLPEKLFQKPYATLVYTNEGELLGAKIAPDGQWRFPVPDTVPEKFKQCLLQFEDQHFYLHPGINPVAIVKALADNVSAGKVVRGGSTLTQQVIRLSRNNRSRTYTEKAIEAVWATRLEWRYSKEEILTLFAAHAPFGGNVVGLEAASWRYFNVPPHELSWAESATLAVLPNAPGLIYPGKNHQLLLAKRNRLLQNLYAESIIDSLTYELSLLETLPSKPFALPNLAPHLVSRLAQTHPGERVNSTLRYDIQKNANALVKKYYENYKDNGVFNAGLIVLDVETREVWTYVGNTPTDALHQKDVDIITANRSTGSTLKPFLYAAALDAGQLLPDALLPDVPTQIAGYQPENFDETYSGAVPAHTALARSLNIPAVRLLQDYGLEKFRHELRRFKLSGINKSAEHYGLTLVLGGAESSLWDLTKAYAALAGTVNHYTSTSNGYFKNEVAEPILTQNKKVDFGAMSLNKSLLGAGSIFLTFEALKEAHRPEGNTAWQYFSSSGAVAWKTGTSFGNRDAWAIGVTSQFAVGVWVGNADGEGRPELTGLRYAAPLLFETFDFLPASKWFQVPFDDLVETEVCAQSGFLPNSHCPTLTRFIPKNGLESRPCPYHHLLTVDKTGNYRVNSSCANLSTDSKSVSKFVLPPLMAHYYAEGNANLPPYKAGCRFENEQIMSFIYPNNYQKIILTKDFDKSTPAFVARVTHSLPGITLFWYLDDTYLGETHQVHEWELSPEAGLHRLTVSDNLGNSLQHWVRIER